MNEPRARAGPSVTAIEHSAPASERYTTVEWMLGNRCNYACSYCPPKLHDGSVPWLDYDQILGFISRLDEHYQGHLGRRLWLNFTGGEPTVYPKFLALIEECRRRGFEQSVISNASRTLRFWRDAARFLNYAIFTYHVEYANREHFFSIVDAVHQDLRVHVNVTMPPDRFDECYETAQALYERFDDITIQCKPLRLNFEHELYPYSDEQLGRTRTRFKIRRIPDGATPRTTMTKVHWDGSRVPQRANEFIVNGENLWRHWHCAAGLEALRIKPGGEVFRSVCGVGGPIGRIDGAVDFPSEPVICDQPKCSCIADILLTKRRSAWAVAPVAVQGRGRAVDACAAG